MRVLKPSALFNGVVLKEQGSWLVMLLILIFGREHLVSVTWIPERSLRGGQDLLRRRVWVDVNQKIIDVKWQEAGVIQTKICLGFIIGLRFGNFHRRRAEPFSVRLIEIAKDAISSREYLLW